MDPLTCSLAMLISGALGAPSNVHALPVTMQDDALTGCVVTVFEHPRRGA